MNLINKLICTAAALLLFGALTSPHTAFAQTHGKPAETRPEETRPNEQPETENPEEEFPDLPDTPEPTEDDPEEDPEDQGDLPDLPDLDVEDDDDDRNATDKSRANRKPNRRPTIVRTKAEKQLLTRDSETREQDRSLATVVEAPPVAASAAPAQQETGPQNTPTAYATTWAEMDALRKEVAETYAPAPTPAPASDTLALPKPKSTRLRRLSGGILGSKTVEERSADLVAALDQLADHRASDAPALEGLDRDLMHDMLTIADTLKKDAISEDVKGHLSGSPHQNKSVGRRIENSSLSAGPLLAEAKNRAEKLKEKIGNSERTRNRSEQLDNLINAVGAHQAELEQQRDEIVENYPNVLGRDNNPTVDLQAEGLEGGANVPPKPTQFDFGDGKGKVDALFKQEDPNPELTSTGELFDKERPIDTILPLRLSQRAKAMEIIATQLLGLKELVVKTEFATANGSGGVFGIVMEDAGRDAPVENDVDVEITEEDRSFEGLQQDLKAWQDAQGTDKEAAAKAKLDLTVVRAGAKMQVDADGKTTFVKPVPARRVSDEQLESGTLRRDLANAGIVDLLCGQVDRHMRNLTVVEIDGKLFIKLFDNDLAFGIEDYFRGATPSEAADLLGFLQALPKTIDAELAAKIMQLTPEQLPGLLKGLLSDLEINAAGKRLEIIKQHVDGLIAQGKTVVLEADQAPASEDRPQLTWAGSRPEDLFHIKDPSKPDDDPDREKSSYYGEIISFRYVAR